MTRDFLPDILAALRSVAPEIDATTVDRKAILVEALDIDSMDFLSFLEALARRFAIDIPEADYPEVRTLDQITAYLAARVGSSGAAAAVR